MKLPTDSETYAWVLQLKKKIIGTNSIQFMSTFLIRTIHETSNNFNYKRPEEFSSRVKIGDFFYIKSQIYIFI